MAQGQLEGLVKKSSLNEAELAVIQQLIAACEDYEQLHTRIEWSMLQERKGLEATDFLYYRDGLLVGYLALDDRGATENEVVAMVHPDYRREGIFRTLLQATTQECQTRGIQQLQLICERSSLSGQACLHAMGIGLDFSEHEMLLFQLKDDYFIDDRLCFRAADSYDFDQLVQVQAESFVNDIEATQRRVTRCLQDPSRQYYLATLGGQDVGCDEPVGILRLDRGNGIVGIYGFGVRPAYQGRGYGRQMLIEAIHTIRASDGDIPISIDVDVNNTKAFNLYHSVGFRIKATYDYYRLDIAH